MTQPTLSASQEQVPSIEVQDRSSSIEVKLRERTDFLCETFPQLDRAKVEQYISALTPVEITKLKIGSFGSLIFDTTFSPGIIPKDKEAVYRQAYASYFRKFCGVEVFDETGMFVYQDEADFYPVSQEGPNNQEFIREWIANIRAVTLLMSINRTEQSPFAFIKINLAEAAICRLAELGEQAENLFNLLPIQDQVRLQEVAEEIALHPELAPGAVFRIANEIEFARQQFARCTSDRPDLIEEAIHEIEDSPRFSALPPEPGQISKSFQADRVNWHDPEHHHILFCNLQSILNNETQLMNWTSLILNCPNYSFPNLHQGSASDNPPTGNSSAV